MIKRNIGISNPEFEIENLRYLTVESSYLKGRGDITVFVPPGCEQKENLPMVILLHGVNASHWAWTRHLNVHNIALKLINSGIIEPMVLVMPSDGLIGGGSGYIDHGEMNFEKWISEDVIEAVRTTISQVGKLSKTFITGLSMGGYGALRIGCKHGELFQGVTGHSSIMSLTDLRTFIDFDPKFDKLESEENLSVFKTILDHKKKLPPFRFDCGKEDELIDSNRSLHHLLKKHGIEHLYKEHSGAHTAEYWSEHIQDSLQFFSKLS